MQLQKKSIIPGCEEMLSRHREEIGEEFGIYHPAASRDLLSSRLTKEIVEQKNNKSNNEKEKDTEK